METCGQGNTKGIEVSQGMHGCSSVICISFLRMRANVLVIGVGCDDVFRADEWLLMLYRLINVKIRVCEKYFGGDSAFCCY